MNLRQFRNKLQKAKQTSWKQKMALQRHKEKSTGMRFKGITQKIIQRILKAERGRVSDYWFLLFEIPYSNW